MKAFEYIQEKQIQWAFNNGIDLQGSKGERGKPAYTLTLNENLFEPLSAETFRAIKEGDGGELSGSPSKMQAVHSSSAVGINVFQYWQNINQPEKIASACKFCQKSTSVSKKIKFEAKYPIDTQFNMHPNIDAVIENDSSTDYKVFAIECKFSEAYGGWEHGGLKPAYLDLEIWDDISNLHKLAISISPKDTDNQFLHAGQLIKHILGLKRAYGRKGFRLLYLWYDALGSEGGRHREEFGKLKEIADADGIKLHGMTFQELILGLAKNYRNEHPEYIAYITTRYL